MQIRIQLSDANFVQFDLPEVEPEKYFQELVNNIKDGFIKVQQGNNLCWINIEHIIFASFTEVVSNQNPESTEPELGHIGTHSSE